MRNAGRLGARRRPDGARGPPSAPRLRRCAAPPAGRARERAMPDHPRRAGATPPGARAPPCQPQPAQSWISAIRNPVGHVNLHRSAASITLRWTPVDPVRVRQGGQRRAKLGSRSARVADGGWRPRGACARSRCREAGGGHRVRRMVPQGIQQKRGCPGSITRGLRGGAFPHEPLSVRFGCQCHRICRSADPALPGRGWLIRGRRWRSVLGQQFLGNLAGLGQDLVFDFGHSLVAHRGVDPLAFCKTCRKILIGTPSLRSSLVRM